jgi:hypothetical protein
MVLKLTKTKTYVKGKKKTMEAWLIFVLIAMINMSF